jgi:hypothetical protein
MIEEHFAILAEDKDISNWLANQVGWALARDGRLRLASQLYRDVQAVREVALPPQYLLDRTVSSLDRVFPPSTQLSVGVIVNAITSDPDRTSALIPRLKALSTARKNDPSTAMPVERVECIPYEDGLVAPAALAFKGNRGDYWGRWKKRLSGKGLSADEQALYRQAGVTSGDPDFRSSLMFFRWLNEQPDSTVSGHLEAIVRHIAHEKSVRSWWEAFPDLPCIPVEAAQSVKLVSRKAALLKGSNVFLPDFEQLANQIRKDASNHNILFAITSHPNVVEPISEYLQGIGAQSLRSVAGTPVSVSGERPADAPSEMVSDFHELQSSRVSHLRKRLSLLEFPMKHLRDDWHNRLVNIKGLMMAASLNARFKVGRRAYQIELSSGFDENTGIIWLKQGADHDDSLFDVLVQRVFREGAPRFAAAVLQKAVRWEFKDVVHAYATTELGLAPEGDLDEPAAELEQGETSQTHRPTVPDPSRNVPRPGPIPSEVPTSIVRSSGFSSRRMEPAKAGTPAIELEVAQIEDLKRNQYAWHCQVCLAERTPSELAPEGSYVALAENRRRLIEAEHADQKHAGGARNVGNIVLLCHFHHRQLGDALSRSLLTEALREATETKQINFASGTDDQAKSLVLEGSLISVSLKLIGTTAKFFFTSAHKDYWLSATAPASDRPR